MLLGGDELGPRSGATTMPTATTPNCRGSTGRGPIAPPRLRPAGSLRCGTTHPVFQRQKFFHRRRPRAQDHDTRYLHWYAPTARDGTRGLESPGVRAVGVYLSGDQSSTRRASPARRHRSSSASTRITTTSNSFCRGVALGPAWMHASCRRRGAEAFVARCAGVHRGGQRCPRRGDTLHRPAGRLGARGWARRGSKEGNALPTRQQPAIPPGRRIQNRHAAANPLWYQDAIIYELHVRAFQRQRRRRHRRLPRPDREARLPAGPRRHRHLAAAVLPLAAARTTATTSPTTPTSTRSYGTLDDFQALPRRGAPPRPAGHHRAGDQPHLRPAPLVPARAPRAARQRRARLLRLERHARDVRRGAHHLQGLRALELDLGPGRQGLLLAPLLPPPARPELRQPRGPRGDASASSTSGSSWASTACGSTPCRTSTSARAPTARTCPRRTPFLQGAARATSTSSFPDRMLLAEANQWPEDAVAYFGDGDECHMAFHFPLMPRLFMALQHGGPLPDRRHPASRRRRSPRTASGRCSCATTTS